MLPNIFKYFIIPFQVLQNQQQAAQLLLAPGQTPTVGYLPLTQVHQQLPGTANGLLAAQTAASSAQPTSTIAAIANAQAQVSFFGFLKSIGFLCEIFQFLNFKALALQQMQQYGISGLPISSNASLHSQLALAAQHQGIIKDGNTKSEIVQFCTCLFAPKFSALYN
jgi:hypothetical protein